MARNTRRNDAAELRKSLLECPVCLLEFDETDQKPRLLPCLHAVCDRCLHLLRENGRIQCPKCRSEHPVEQNFANIPFDRTRRSLATFVKVDLNFEITCENCENRNKATHRCRECEIFFCEDCVNAHQRIRSFRRRHTVFSLQRSQNEEYTVSDFASQQFCEDHEDQKLSFYCCGLRCGTPICQTCYTLRHSQGSDHDVRDIGEVYETEKLKLMDLSGSVENRAKEAERIEVTVKQAQRELTDNTQKAISTVNETFASCIRILERRQKHHIQTIREKFDQKHKMLEEQKHQLFSYTDCIRSDNDFFRQTLTAENKAGFLTIAPSIAQKFKLLRDQSIDKYPIQTAHITFEKKNMIADFTTCVQTLGDVMASLICVPNTKMSVPSAPRRNADYSIEVHLFDKDHNVVTLDNENVTVTVKSPNGDVTLATCVKRDNIYILPWRPLLEGNHIVTSLVFNGKTELARQEVNVDCDPAEKSPAVATLHSIFPNVSIDGIVSCLLAEGGDVEKAKAILIQVTSYQQKKQHEEVISPDRYRSLTLTLSFLCP
ncbi:E3 ubiquitin-protein ligase TRIM56-like [Pecten maximus]|uniref:E3 ubiquitin-protein ligase TRIM56-like n=1 Tax=Pecten maximus TaxID=6579 RepID=UPI001458B313|nr:E3 ubiquitin-protein ligase TRIM56-like [Pecten maximus]